MTENVNFEQTLQLAAEKCGTPCYLYVARDFTLRAQLARSAFGGAFKLSYAVKANPNRHLLNSLKPEVDYFDVPSGGELSRLLSHGFPAERISFSGPGKSTKELALSVSTNCGQVVVESVEEAGELSELACRSDTVIR